VIEARCKINLGLEVLRRRPDGFHDIDTVFQSVSLCDVLEIESAPRGVVRLEVEGASVSAGPENLVWRAALAHAKATGAPGAAIVLRKRVPVAAGLGGGSSDAAATLVGLDRLHGTGLPPREIRRLALAIGSDVPYFVEGGTARGGGRGEVLEPLPSLRGVWFVLVTPPAQVAARAAYEALRIGLTRPGGFINLVCSAIQERDHEALARALANDLEPGVVALCPEVGSLLTLLRERGAAGAVMTGSGPTAVGVSLRKDDADRIAASLEGHGRRVHVVEPVDAGSVVTQAS
jgi:4-diphosphocytidyl-2-C-methyl-D-erythritol kinase